MHDVDTSTIKALRVVDSEVFAVRKVRERQDHVYTYHRSANEVYYLFRDSNIMLAL